MALSGGERHAACLGAWRRSRSGSTPDRAGDTPLDAEFHAGFIFCIYLIARGRLTDLLAVECFLAVGPLFRGMCAIGRARARTLASHGGGGATGSAPFALLTAVVSGRALAAGFSAELVFLEVMQFRPSGAGQGSRRGDAGARCAALVVLDSALVNFPWWWPWLRGGR